MNLNVGGSNLIWNVCINEHLFINEIFFYLIIINFYFNSCLSDVTSRRITINARFDSRTRIFRAYVIIGNNSGKYPVRELHTTFCQSRREWIISSKQNEFIHHQINTYLISINNYLFSTQASSRSSSNGSHHSRHAAMTLDELRDVNRYAESTKSLSYLPQVGIGEA